MPKMMRTPPPTLTAKSCRKCSSPDNEQMVQCDDCDLWYHFVCVNVTQDVENHPWSCPTCLQKQETANGAQNQSDAHQKDDKKRDEVSEKLSQIGDPSKTIRSSTSSHRQLLNLQLQKLNEEQEARRKQLVIEQEARRKQLALEQEILEAQKTYAIEEKRNREERYRLLEEIANETSSNGTQSVHGSKSIVNKQVHVETWIQNSLVHQGPELIHSSTRVHPSVTNVAMLNAKSQDQANGTTLHTITQQNPNNTSVTGQQNVPGTSAYPVQQRHARLPAMVNFSPGVPQHMQPTQHMLPTQHMQPTQHMSTQHTQYQSHIQPLPQIHLLSGMQQPRHAVQQMQPPRHAMQQMQPSRQPQCASVNATHMPIGHQGQNVPAQSGQSFNFNGDGYLSQSQLAARQINPKELPKFEGNPEDWPMFITAYEESTRMCGYTNQENMFRLQRCLKGKPFDMLKGDLMHPNNVPTVISTLRMLYGRPANIINSLIHRTCRA